jgi:CxxC motif-containing protein (DUF1111 family)
VSAADEAAYDVAEGFRLFKHEWKQKDPLCPDGDGVGPAYNAVSCIACHFQGGIGGAGDNKNNVQLISIRSPRLHGAKANVAVIHPSLAKSSTTMLHLFNVNAEYDSWRELRTRVRLPRSKDGGSSRLQKLLDDDSNPGDDKFVVMGIPLTISSRHTPALFGLGLIDKIPDSAIRDEARRQAELKDGISGRAAEVARQIVRPGDPAVDEARPGRAGRFGEPLTSVGRFGWRGQTASLRDFVFGACAVELGLEVPGQPQDRDPLGKAPPAPGLDLTLQQCDQIVAFVASLPRPEQVLPPKVAYFTELNQGARVFERVGCAACHVEQLGNVRGLYSDLLVHDMGPDLAAPVVPTTNPSNAYYGSSFVITPEEWRTPPLWGVADSAPYLHDGRAATLHEAIEMHGGEAKNSVKAYKMATGADRELLLMFLKSLAAPKNLSAGPR